jgi:hypothetical protein
MEEAKNDQYYGMDEDGDMDMGEEMEMNMEGLHQQMQQNNYNPLRQKDY